jgi:C-terminal processing protease CtpA/Prc
MAFSDWEHPGAFFYLEDVKTDIPYSLKCSLFKGKTFFLINESTQSHLETKAWMARTCFHATLIGRPTSGALGQVVWIPLQESNAAFSGVGLFSLDGTELQ